MASLLSNLRIGDFDHTRPLPRYSLDDGRNLRRQNQNQAPLQRVVLSRTTMAQNARRDCLLRGLPGRYVWRLVQGFVKLMIHLHHVHLFSQYLDATVAWYRRAFDADVYYDGDFGGSRNVFMKIGSVRILILGQPP